MEFSAILKKRAHAACLKSVALLISWIAWTRPWLASCPWPTCLSRVLCGVPVRVRCGLLSVCCHLSLGLAGAQEDGRFAKFW